MTYNRIYIPGVESWVLDDINVDLNINSGASDDEELEVQEAEAIAEQSENQEESAAIQAEDTAVNTEMALGFRGYHQLERMQAYLAAGGSYRTLEQLFDMRQYLGRRSYVSGTEAFESIKQGAKDVGNFIKELWKKIVILIQRIIPWFGQNTDTLHKRLAILRTELAKLNRTANYDLDTGNSEYKEKKVIDMNDAVKHIDEYDSKLRAEGTPDENPSVTDPERKLSVSTIADKSKLEAYVANITKSLIKLKKMESYAEDFLTTAKRKANGQVDDDYAEKEVTAAKKRVSAMRVYMSNGCKWLRYAIDDAFWMVKTMKKKEKKDDSKSSDSSSSEEKK